MTAPPPAGTPWWRHVPVVPTLVVLAAVLLMVRLGTWQLSRLHEKRALVAHAQANRTKPLAPFIALWPVEQTDLFRRTAVTCIATAEWQALAGRDMRGQAGWRHVAACRTGAEGPGVLVDMGVSQRPDAPVWRGGRVTGRLTLAPDNQPLVAHLVGAASPPQPLVVSEMAAPGLSPSEQPDPATIPNNHLAYAVQWFLFAAVAVVIYLLLLVRRIRRARA